MTMPTIVPCIWLDDEAEAAAAFYAEIFPSSAVRARTRYPGGFDNPAGKPRGSVLTVEMDLMGAPFTLLNGGPSFRPDPAVSFFAHAHSLEETERMALALAEGGRFLMELAAYPWSPRYAWVEDRYGVSWQVMLRADASEEQRIQPSLLFCGEVFGRAEEALTFYASVFPEGEVGDLMHVDAATGADASLQYGLARLAGQELVAMDSGLEQEAAFSEGLSLQVLCRDQAEVDHFWSALAEGGQESRCGWLEDRFGLSWQVIPRPMLELMAASGGEGPGYERAFQAMLEMDKLDVAALQAAYEGSA